MRRVMKQTQPYNHIKLISVNILSILLAVRPFTVLLLETSGFIKIYLQQIEKKLPEVKMSSSAFPYVDNY